MGSNLRVTWALCPGARLGHALTIWYGALVLSVNVTLTDPSFFTVRVFSIGNPTFSVRSPQAPMLLHCSLNTNNPLPKSRVAGLKLTLCAMPVALTVLLPALLLIVMPLEKLPAVAELNLTTTSCGCPGSKLKLAPDTMLNGAGTETVPLSLPPPPFQITNDACVCWVMNVCGTVRLVVERLIIGVRLVHR
uniref:Uncharacterized protein n=1 Tax=uncultured Acetothermia bacterium TaxID=236499 RepID=H5S923_9BACT|nr:hypothetical protein HGMM_F02E06C23 [uncultured Acetothermia bacterium]